ncbi:MAG: hypothetical protein P8X73_01640 [Ignavibacteriaceae bacterium]
MKNVKIDHVVIFLIILSFFSLSFAQTDKEKTFSVTRGDKLKVLTSFGNITYDLVSGSQVKVVAKNVWFR